MANVKSTKMANLLFGVPLSIWYDWKNDGPDPAEREHNFGTVTAGLKPKPAYLAIQTLTRQLGGYRISRRLSVGDENDFVLLCANDAGRQAITAWSSGDPHTLRVELAINPPRRLTGVNSDGTSFVPKTEAGALLLELTGAPQYVKLGEKDLIR